MRNVLVRSLAELSVIAYQEIPTDIGLQPVALIRPEDGSAGQWREYSRARC